MHERSLRRWLLVAFWGLCIAPTILTAVWAVSHQTGYYRRALEGELSRQWGERISIERLSYPGPRKILLAGVRVSDEETNATIATARMMEVHRLAVGTLVHVSQPEVELAQASRFWDWLDQQLLRIDRWSATDIAVNAQEVILKSTGIDRTLREFRCLMARGEEAPVITVDFQDAGDDTGARAELRITRDRQTIPASSHFELTCRSPMPCLLLGNSVVAFVGPSATFSGKVFAHHANHRWAFDIEGIDQQTPAELAHLSLWSLVGDRFPHTELEGEAKVRCEAAEIRQQQLTRFKGSLEAGPGRIAGRFLTTAAKELDLQYEAGALAGDNRIVNFDLLSFRIAWEPSKSDVAVTIEGACPDHPTGMLLAEGNQVIVSTPSGRRAVRTTDLVAALAPASEIHVPATAQTNWLLSFLPSPSAVPAPHATPAAVIKIVSAQEELPPPTATDGKSQKRR